MGVKNLTPIMADGVCRRGKEDHAISSDTCVDHYILLLKYLSNHMHFIKSISNTFQRPTRLIQGNLFL